jgi:hypothetical protein
MAIRWAGRVAQIGKTIGLTVYKISVSETSKRCHLENLGAKGRIILK